MRSVIIRQTPSLRLSPRQDGILDFRQPTHSCIGCLNSSFVVSVLYHKRMIAVSIKEFLTSLEGYSSTVTI